jgi:hypothetical protein
MGWDSNRTTSRKLEDKSLRNRTFMLTENELAASSMDAQLAPSQDQAVNSAGAQPVKYAALGKHSHPIRSGSTIRERLGRPTFN